MATNPQTDSAAPLTKQIHSLVLDTGPLIKNDPPASVLLSRAEQLYTLPAIISEIRDAATRSRVETTLLPFVKLRSPRPDSVKFITAFARKTGDLAVLSRPDIEVLALGYELECERNNGDWRLRNSPGQQRLNGRPAGAEEAKTEATGPTEEGTKIEDTEGKEINTETEPIVSSEAPTVQDPTLDVVDAQPAQPEQPLEESILKLALEETATETAPAEAPSQSEESTPAPAVQPIDSTDRPAPLQDGEKADETLVEEAEASDSDEDGWITPSNLKKHQAKDTSTSTPTQPTQKTLQAAVLTSDFAMQNVALRMNLNLVAPSLARITHLKTWVLRCHGCFTITKDMAKQFCPSCGQPTLLRTSCSTDDRGQFRVHLKRNFQWNNRGNVYSVPKPVHGTANGRLAKHAGGKNNWGAGLVLAEDQKEFTRANEERQRTRKKDLMDEDYMPNILSGDRAGAGGRTKVGVGRNINGRKKR